MVRENKYCNRCYELLTRENYYRYKHKNRFGECNLCYNERQALKRLTKIRKTSKEFKKTVLYDSFNGKKILDGDCGRSMVFLEGRKKKDLLASGIPKMYLKSEVCGSVWHHKIRICDLRRLGYSESVIDYIKKIKFHSD